MANVQHSTQTGLELHEDKRIKEPVRAASTTNIILTAPGALIDNVTMAAGDRFLAKDQTLPAENGIYVWNGISSTATRATDASTTADFLYLFAVGVREGAVNTASLWLFSQTATFTLATTAATFVRISATGATGAQGPAGATGAVGPAAVLSAAPYICLQHSLPAGTNGGSFASGSWQTRPLNLVQSDDTQLVTLASNQFTLAAGTYRIHGESVAYAVSDSQTRIRNITDGQTMVVGLSVFCSSLVAFACPIAGRFAISSTKVLEFQHRCTATRNTDGFGPQGSLGENEVYANLEIWLEGLPPPVSRGMVQENPSFEVTYRRQRAAWLTAR